MRNWRKEGKNKGKEKESNEEKEREENEKGMKRREVEREDMIMGRRQVTSTW